MLTRAKPPSPQSSMIHLHPIGTLHTPFTTPQGTPIQPAYADQPATVELDPAFALGLQDLDGFEQLWPLTWLHHGGPGPLLVTPFRDDRPHGVFATRAPRRPNPIGLSRVRLLRIEGTTLHLSGVDLLDGTPVLDIKPYVPAFDAAPDSRAGWLDEQRDERTVADGRFAIEPRD